MRAFLKTLLFIMLLAVSPLVLAFIAGAIFLGIQLGNGNELSKGVENLIAVVYSLTPYLPYITGVPALLVFFFLVTRNRKYPS